MGQKIRRPHQWACLTLRKCFCPCTLLLGFLCCSVHHADLARYIHIWQEVHFDFYRAIARAGLATTTFDVKREPAGFIATHLGLGGICKKVADMVKDASIGGGIRPWRTPNW